MKNYYSPSGAAFYSAKLTTEASRPADCKPIPNDKFKAAVNAVNNGGSLSFDAQDHLTIHDAPVPSVEVERVRNIERLHFACGSARARFIPPGALAADALQIIHSLAQDWRTNGGPVPSCVSDRARAYKLTNNAAADAIIAEYDAFKAGVQSVESIRIDTLPKLEAEVNPSAMESLVAAAVSALGAL